MSFLVLKPEYPHESASNSLFSVKKGEILECPPGYEPSDSFQVCESRESAEQYIKLINKVSSHIVSQQAAKAEESQKDKLFPLPTYPLFRKVASIGDDDSAYQLFSRDIHRFLARDETEILEDLENVKLHYNSAARILEYEQKHFTREKIIATLEARIKEEEILGEEKNATDKEKLTLNDVSTFGGEL